MKRTLSFYAIDEKPDAQKVRETFKGMWGNMASDCLRKKQAERFHRRLLSASFKVDSFQCPLHVSGWGSVCNTCWPWFCRWPLPAVPFPLQVKSLHLGKVLSDGSAGIGVLAVTGENSICLTNERIINGG